MGARGVPLYDMGMFGRYVEYIRNNPEHYWFRRKLWGWGWTPATREGWSVTVGYIGLVLALALTLDESASEKDVALAFLLPLTLLTMLFVLIAYKTGEPPKWQWGIPDDEDSTT